MKFGVQIRPTDESIEPSHMARLVEEHGFESLFFPEHTHIPLTTASLEPDDPEWLDTCKHMLDPFVALTAAAAVTTRLRLGTGISLVAEHDPIVLAKEVATLDRLSGGRFLFGIGAGWNEPEMRHHGVDPRRRWARVREHVLAMSELWIQERAEFHGDFVDFGPSYQWPKPLQQPRPPILIAGEGPQALDRVLDYGDGWMPNDFPEAGERVTALNRRTDGVGRTRIPVTIYSCVWDRALVERYAELGVDRCVFTIAAFDHPGIERGLLQLTDLTAGLMTSSG